MFEFPWFCSVVELSVNGLNKTQITKNNQSKTMSEIGYQRYGKSHVRVMRVNKRPERHELVELSVQVLLEGTLFDASYLTGDNSKVVPTDTVKNSIYILARQHDCLQIEDYALLVVKHFLKEYSHVR
jgi:urate oxidase